MDDSVNIRDYKAFPRPVAAVIAEAVNKHGVKVRRIDGAHARLYNGDRNVVPIKIAAVRDAEHTLAYLIPWLEQHVPSWTQDTEVTRDKVELLAAAVTTEPKAKPVPAKPVVASEVAPKATPKPVTKPGSAMSPDLVIPKDLICTWPGCGRKAKNTSGYRMHMAGHTGEKKEHAAKGVETYRLNREQNQIIAEQAIAALAKIHGVEIGGGDAAKIKELEKALAHSEKHRLAAIDTQRKMHDVMEQLKKERDDFKARIELLEEAFRGTK